MRIAELRLDRFGHFTDRRFDFGPRGARPDFHILYGANEAGKTTTMEAALRLFYGFPLREAYAFRHPRANLQVSATLEIDGQRHDFTRLPKRDGALLDGTGTALPEAALSTHLAGLAEEDYRKLLCLDDTTIERGGEEIVQARSDIGRLLFSAAAGVADLSQVLDDVREEADAIWKKRARATRLAGLKRDLAEMDKTIRERDVSASAWRGLKRTFADAQHAERDARGARDALQRRAAGLAAQRRVLPMMAEIADLDARITPVADFPAQLDFDPDRLADLQSDAATARHERDRLDAEIGEKTRARDAIILTPQLVSLSEDLDALDDLRSRDRTAALDLARREDQLRQETEAMADAARDLGVPRDVDPATLVLSPADLAQLDTARETLRAARATTAREAQELAALTDRLAAAQAGCDALPEGGGDAPEIGAILQRHDIDRLMPAHATAQQALDTARTAARAALRAQAVGDVTFDALPALPISLARARDWAERHAALVQSITATEAQATQHATDHAARRARAAALTGGRALVPDAEAEALKDQRDRLWQAHAAALSPGTAQPFADAMRALDAAMEARLAHARDLGELRRIEQDMGEAKARADEAEARLATLRDTRDALERDVDAAAATLGLPTPMLPVEWRDWVDRHGQAAQAAAHLAETRAAHAPVLDRAQRLLKALAAYLPLDSPDIDSAVAMAREIAEADRARAMQRAKAREALEQAQADLFQRQAKQEVAANAEAEAADRWQRLVQDLLAGAVAPETLLASLAPLHSLRERHELCATAAQRVATMQDDRTRFAAAVAALAAEHGLPAEDGAAAQFDSLRRLSEAARLAHEKHAALESAIRIAKDNLTAQTDRLAQIEQDVAAMASLFPERARPRDLDGLRRVTAQARQVIADRADRARLERAVLTDLGVADMQAARDALADVTMADLDAKTETVASDLAQAEADLTRATEARVTAQGALAQVTGGQDIAALTERRTTLELQLEDAARRHLELSLGHRLASDAIRRYRDSHRSGMMAATERCFAVLTNGAYPRLTTQPEGAEEILLAVGADGGTKRAAEMSKGTRFQLYLALRAAAHEQLVAQGTCLPFFCDDVFETFDEDRTSAACQVMEDIGRRGQAIYLTHHRHVVDIAQAVCKTPPVVHEF
ncbi:hypothetical protein DZD18_12870 [Rhodobacteraceae bacterium W635]|uniref:YhaN family protein n=1 Tax=Nioella halotolerans TaxID=2303578 RepID=UPI000E3D429B|nr:hypothetical protein DZD18_12870 [Rhodobacteraceae bacterium W635]